MLNVKGGYLELLESEGTTPTIIFHFEKKDVTYRWMDRPKLFVALNRAFLEKPEEISGYTVGPIQRNYKPNIDGVLLRLKDSGLCHRSEAVVSYEQLKNAVWAPY